MALKDLLKTFKAPPKKESICGEIDRYLLTKRGGKDISRPYDERVKFVHHPSSLSSVECLRALVYGWLDTTKSNSQNTAKSYRIFDTGHDFGYRMQAYFWDMGILLGEWKCVICTHRWLDMENPSPRTCPSCAAELVIGYNLHYLEVPILDKERNILGKSDGAILRPWGRQLIELKTIKNRDVRAGERSVCFEDLIQPRQSHTEQLMLYIATAAKMYGKKSEEDLNSGVIIYGGKNNHELKEFFVSLVDEVLQKLYLKAEVIDSCVNNGQLPARLCENKDCYECKYCSYTDICWSGATFKDVDNRKTGVGK